MHFLHAGFFYSKLDMPNGLLFPVINIVIKSLYSN